MFVVCDIYGPEAKTTSSCETFVAPTSSGVTTWARPWPSPGENRPLGAHGGIRSRAEDPTYSENPVVPSNLQWDKNGHAAPVPGRRRQQLGTLWSGQGSLRGMVRGAEGH